MARFVLLLVLLVSLDVSAWAAPGPAVVVVPVASVFGKPSAKAERVTQALLGERVTIVKEEGGWARIYIPDQYRLTEGYPGWMLRSELQAAPAKSDSPVVIVRTARASLSATIDGKPVTTAFLGTHLESAGEAQRGWLPVRVPGQARTAWVRASDVTPVLTATDGNDVIKTALLLRGTRYLWGGLSAAGIDCSGLTYESYGLYGITLPRDADQQFLVGTPVARADLQAGDLLFFGKDAHHITHVGMYMANGHFVEAAGKSGVTVSPLSGRSGFQGARRVLGVTLTMPPPSP